MTIEGCAEGGIVLFPSPVLCRYGNLWEVLRKAWKNIVSIPEKVMNHAESSATDWSVRLVLDDSGLARIEEVTGCFMGVEEVLFLIGNILEKS